MARRTHRRTKAQVARRNGTPGKQLPAMPNELIHMILEQTMVNQRSITKADWYEIQHQFPVALEKIWDVFSDDHIEDHLDDELLVRLLRRYASLNTFFYSDDVFIRVAYLDHATHMLTVGRHKAGTRCY